MGPAGATVGWYVLVEDIGQVILAINVAPENLFWEFIEVFKSLPDLWFGSVWIADTAWVLNESIL